MSLQSHNDTANPGTNSLLPHSQSPASRSGGEGVFVQLAFMLAVVGYYLVVSLMRLVGGNNRELSV